jgi:hypothetical protein
MTTSPSDTWQEYSTSPDKQPRTVIHAKEIIDFNELCQTGVVSAIIWILVDSIVFCKDRYFRPNTWHFVESKKSNKNSSRRRLHCSVQ